MLRILMFFSLLSTIDFKTAREHELKPHRLIIPVAGAHSGSNQIGLTITVSPTGEVLDIKVNADDDTRKFWPQVEAEVRAWKYRPFEKDGQPVTAEIQEYVNLVPPERLPTNHVNPPRLRPDSKIVISLTRTMCYGSCPAYKVTVTNDKITFDGGAHVAAKGIQTDKADANEVRKLAAKFVAADFYSMDASYRESITDNPTYVLSISIDGRTKTVEDYVGYQVGMPAVITELEKDVDTLARTQRWIKP